jgi:uncharacterized protein YukE
MDTNDILLRIARAVVNGAIQTINNQVTLVENMVKAPLKAIVQSVIGTYWTGDGADRFADEMASLFFPDLDKVCNTTTGLKNALDNAVAIMNAAEAKATQTASQLEDVFVKIYQ